MQSLVVCRATCKGLVEWWKNSARHDNLSDSTAVWLRFTVSVENYTTDIDKSIAWALVKNLTIPVRTVAIEVEQLRFTLLQKIKYIPQFHKSRYVYTEPRNCLSSSCKTRKPCCRKETVRRHSCSFPVEVRHSSHSRLINNVLESVERRSGTR